MPASAATHAHVQRMLDEIHTHYADPLNLGTLSRRLGRQAAYLGRLFREEVGATVHDYVTRLRLEQGAAQVRLGVKIEAVALCIGYRSKKNFYRQFRRHYGCTPDQYRHRLQDVEAAVQLRCGRSEEAGARTTVTSVPARAVRPAGAVVARARADVPGDSARHAARVGLKLTLLAQEVVLRTFVGSPLAMLLTDENGRCVGANSAAARMTGYAMADLRLRSAGTLLTSDQPLRGTALLLILIPPSARFPANAVLHTKASVAVDVHCISSRNPMWTGAP